jgi:SulP family sulfate permease
MVPWRELRDLRRFSMFYRAILLTTLALTVIFDLTVAVEVGLVLSSLFYIYRVSALTRVDRVDLGERSVTPGGRRVAAWRVFGSIFFGSVNKLENLFGSADPLPDVVILEMHKVINMDTTGLDTLEALHAALVRRGGRLVLADLNEQPRSLLGRSGFLEELGRENLFDEFEAAVESARAG